MGLGLRLGFRFGLRELVLVCEVVRGAVDRRNEIVHDVGLQLLKEVASEEVEVANLARAVLVGEVRLKGAPTHPDLDVRLCGTLEPELL